MDTVTPHNRPTLLPRETAQEEGWQFFDPRCLRTRDLSNLTEDNITGILQKARLQYKNSELQQADYDLALLSEHLLVQTIGMTEDDICIAIYARNPNQTIAVSEAGTSLRSILDRVKGLFAGPLT